MNDITVTLHVGHARALIELVGRRPHTEQWSKAVYDALLEAIKKAREAGPPTL